MSVGIGSFEFGATDVRILSGLQIKTLQYICARWLPDRLWVSRYCVFLPTLATLLSRRRRRRRSTFPRIDRCELPGTVFCCEEEDGVEVVVADLPPFYG